MGAIVVAMVVGLIAVGLVVGIIAFGALMIGALKAVNAAHEGRSWYVNRRHHKV
ncbi:hypothetical protein QFW96_10245 [Saccharopolyspora sp. TS4A08]|uniref:Uncharacterized protein n=1 Tax=Saccharopolyspora ipomoeae TaxID=3042027 RepID=A0ABT6PLW2_9PSEU|nr:hypothetical protein [Saccharopolyspora sp. TS4A08]MDI2028994.1 hypothetical protein [Saccharopolyspora sp. TS4A08]